MSQHRGWWEPRTGWGERWSRQLPHFGAVPVPIPVPGRGGSAAAPHSSPDPAAAPPGAFCSTPCPGNVRCRLPKSPGTSLPTAAPGLLQHKKPQRGAAAAPSPSHGTFPALAAKFAGDARRRGISRGGTGSWQRCAPRRCPAPRRPLPSLSLPFLSLPSPGPGARFPSPGTRCPAGPGRKPGAILRASLGRILGELLRGRRPPKTSPGQVPASNSCRAALRCCSPACGAPCVVLLPAGKPAASWSGAQPAFRSTLAVGSKTQRRGGLGGCLLLLGSRQVHPGVAVC